MPQAFLGYQYFLWMWVEVLTSHEIWLLIVSPPKLLRGNRKITIEITHKHYFTSCLNLYNQYEPNNYAWISFIFSSQFRRDWYFPQSDCYQTITTYSSINQLLQSIRVYQCRNSKQMRQMVRNTNHWNCNFSMHRFVYWCRLLLTWF